MKNFISSMLGSLVAIVLAGGALLLLALGLVGALIAAGSHKAPKVAQGSYLVFNLDTNITDASPGVEFGTLFDQRPDNIQLRATLRALRAATHDDRIRGLLLLGNLQPGGYGTSYAALREVRAAVADFKAAGKPVRA